MCADPSPLPGHPRAQLKETVGNCQTATESATAANADCQDRCNICLAEEGTLETCFALPQILSPTAGPESLLCTDQNMVRRVRAKAEVDKAFVFAFPIRPATTIWHVRHDLHVSIRLKHASVLVAIWRGTGTAINSAKQGEGRAHR